MPDSCPRCGARFACGIDSGRCWCAGLPALAALPDDLPPACLCPACLRELSQRQASTHEGDADGVAPRGKPDPGARPPR